MDWERFQKVNIYRKCWPVRTPVSYFGKKMRAHRKKRRIFEHHGRGLLCLSGLNFLHDGKRMIKSKLSFC